MVLIDILIYLGASVSAIAGALSAVRKHLDFFGVATISIVSAVGGGSIRDVLIGNFPPISFRNEILLCVVLASGCLTFCLHRHIKRFVFVMYWFDTAGLAILSVLGAESGMSAHLGLVGVLLIAAISGAGGGLLRNLLIGQIPTVLLPGELYASAAMGGASVTYFVFSWNQPLALFLGAFVTFSIRVASTLLSKKYQVM